MKFIKLTILDEVGGSPTTALIALDTVAMFEATVYQAPGDSFTIVHRRGDTALYAAENIDEIERLINA